MKYWAFCIIVEIWDEKSRLEDSLMPRVVTIEEVGIERRSGEVSLKNVLDLENIIESVLVILRERNSQRTKNVDQPGMMKEMTLCEYDQYGVGMRYTVGDHQHIDDI